MTVNVLKFTEITEFRKVFFREDGKFHPKCRGREIVHYFDS